MSRSPVQQNTGTVPSWGHDFMKKGLQLPQEAIPKASWAVCQGSPSGVDMADDLCLQMGCPPLVEGDKNRQDDLKDKFLEVNLCWSLQEHKDEQEPQYTHMVNSPADKYEKLNVMSDIGGILALVNVVTEVSDADEVSHSDTFAIILGAPSVPSSTNGQVGFSLEDLSLEQDMKIQPMGVPWGSSRVFPFVCPMFRGSREGTGSEMLKLVQDNWESIWQFEHGLKTCRTILTLGTPPIRRIGEEDEINDASNYEDNFNSRMWIPTDESTGTTKLHDSDKTGVYLPTDKPSSTGAFLHNLVMILPAGHNLPLGFCVKVDENFSLDTFKEALKEWKCGDNRICFDWLSGEWCVAWFDATRRHPSRFVRTVYSWAQMRVSIAPMVLNTGNASMVWEKAFKEVYWRIVFRLFVDRVKYWGAQKKRESVQKRFQIYVSKAMGVLLNTPGIPNWKPDFMLPLWQLTPPSVQAWNKDLELAVFAQALPSFSWNEAYAPWPIVPEDNYEAAVLPLRASPGDSSVAADPSAAAAALLKKAKNFSLASVSSPGTPDTQVADGSRTGESLPPNRKLFGTSVPRTTDSSRILPPARPANVTQSSLKTGPPVQGVPGQVIVVPPDTGDAESVMEMEIFSPTLSIRAPPQLTLSPWNPPSETGLSPMTLGPYGSFTWFDHLAATPRDAVASAASVPEKMSFADKIFSHTAFQLKHQSPNVDFLGFLGGIYLSDPKTMLLVPTEESRLVISREWSYIPGVLGRHFLRGIGCDSKFNSARIATFVFTEMRRAAKKRLFGALPYMTPAFPPQFFEQNAELLEGLHSLTVGDGAMYGERQHQKWPTEVTFWHMAASSPEAEGGKIPSNGYSAGRGMCQVLANFIALMGMMFDNASAYDNLPHYHDSPVTISNPFIGSILVVVTHLNDPAVAAAWDSTRTHAPAKGRTLTIGLLYHLCTLVEIFRDWTRTGQSGDNYCLDFVAYSPRKEQGAMRTKKSGGVMTTYMEDRRCVSVHLQEWTAHLRSWFSAGSILGNHYQREWPFRQVPPSIILQSATKRASGEDRFGIATGGGKKPKASNPTVAVGQSSQTSSAITSQQTSGDSNQNHASTGPPIGCRQRDSGHSFQAFTRAIVGLRYCPPTGGSSDLSSFPSAARVAVVTAQMHQRGCERGVIRKKNDRTYDARARHFAQWLEGIGFRDKSLASINSTNAIPLLTAYLHLLIEDPKTGLRPQAQGLQAGTLRNYLTSATQWLTSYLGIPVVISDSQGNLVPVLRDMLNRVRKWQQPKPKIEPYTQEMFQALYQWVGTLRKEDSQAFLGIEASVFDWVCLGIFTGSRGNEYCQTQTGRYKYSRVPICKAAGSFQGSPIAFMRSDFKLFNEKGCILSRVEAFQQPQAVVVVEIRFRYDKSPTNFSVRKFSRTGHKYLCPVTACISILQRAVLLGAPSNEPLSVIKWQSKGIPSRPYAYLTSADVINVMRSSVERAYPESHYLRDPSMLTRFTCHSNRVTAAVALSAAGMPIDLIAFKLRWDPQSVKHYLRDCSTRIGTTTATLIQEQLSRE